MDIRKTILLSDMDGTLLTSKKTISAGDRAALEKFIALGGKFTIATGRTIQTFEQYRDMLPIHMPVIMYNGGGIYDYSREELLCCSPLPETSREMSIELLRLMPDIGGEVLTDKGTYVFSNTEYQQLHTRLCGITPDYMSLEEIPGDERWLKVLFALAPEDVPHLQLLTEQLGYVNRVDFVRSSDIFLEMLPKGNSKGSALEEYRKLEGMEDFTFIAIGDFDNDLEMIKAADIGVCPANAEESVKSAADIVLTHTNDQGAVAELIQRITDNSLS